MQRDGATDEGAPRGAGNPFDGDDAYNNPVFANGEAGGEAYSNPFGEPPPPPLPPPSSQAQQGAVTTTTTSSFQFQSSAATTGGPVAVAVRAAEVEIDIDAHNSKSNGGSVDFSEMMNGNSHGDDEGLVIMPFRTFCSGTRRRKWRREYGIEFLDHVDRLRKA